MTETESKIIDILESMDERCGYLEEHHREKDRDAIAWEFREWVETKPGDELSYLYITFHQ